MPQETVVLPVTKEGFSKLPRGAQLLVAYVLTNDLFSLELSKTDADMIALANAGWIEVKPSFTHGIVNGQFSDQQWQGLEDIEAAVMATVSKDELERYKMRKGKAYPWLW